MNRSFGLVVLVGQLFFSSSYAVIKKGQVRPSANCAGNLSENKNPSTSTKTLNLKAFKAKIRLIRKRMFVNRSAPIPELRSDVNELISMLKRVEAETRDEIESYKPKDGSQKEDAQTLVPEFLSSRARLYSWVLYEAQTLSRRPQLITFDRFNTLFFRASIASVRLPETQKIWGIQLMVYKLRQELKLLGLGDKDPNDLDMADFESASYPKYRIQFEEVLQAAPRHIALSVLHPFNLTKIVSMYDEESSPLEYILGIEKADRVERNGSNFYDHDVNHTHMYLAADPEMNWNSPILTLAEFKARHSVRNAFRKGLRDQISALTGDIRTYSGGMYTLLHERVGQLTGQLHTTPQSFHSFFRTTDLGVVRNNIAGDLRSEFKLSNLEAVRLAEIFVSAGKTVAELHDR